MAGRPDLLDEGQSPGVLADRVRIGRLIAGADHDANLFDAGLNASSTMMRSTDFWMPSGQPASATAAMR